MKTAFNLEDGQWEIAWPGRVAKHDLVYHTPPLDPMQGLPLGNGEVGALFWCEETRVIIALNRTDLWDDATFEGFRNWSLEEEERNTTLRHGCRLIIDFGYPLFDLFYIRDFQGRLSLADTSTSLTLSGAFGSCSLHAFVDHDSGVLRCKIEMNLQEDVPATVSLERYGSRTFAHWYAQINRDPSIGLAGTEGYVDVDYIFVSHELTSGTFWAGCSCLTEASLPKSSRRLSAHKVTTSIQGNAHKAFEIIAALSEPLEEGGREKIRHVLNLAKVRSFESSHAEHASAWKQFWLRSFVETDEPYLDALWHLTMFYAYASQRGKYPGHFINGLWSWSRDVKNWNFYFHWNQQQLYWPLNAAGHHELCKPYLEYRWRGLPHAKSDARTFFDSDGAVVSDVSERRGYNSICEFKNHTPVAQIALDFWRHYQFTQDETFLKERALPYLQEAAAFFASLFQREDDGKFHARAGTGYEGWIVLKDVISELAYGNVLFSTVLEALSLAGVTDERAGHWREIAENMAPLTLVDAKSRGYLDDAGQFAIGTFRGSASSSGEVLAAGYSEAEECWLNSILPATPKNAELGLSDTVQELEAGLLTLPDLEGDSRCNDGIFPWVENAVVFPSGLVGLSAKDSATFRAAADTARIFAPNAMGWDVLPIVLARLGLADETWKILTDFPVRWQLYVNGWGHYGPRSRAIADGALHFRLNHVIDTGAPSASPHARFPFPSWPFRHMGMEAMSVLATAMNESLLQSHEGIIRIGPAVQTTQSVRFTLHAAGGFKVSSEIVEGQPLWIAVQSLKGGECSLASPWSSTAIFRNGDFVGNTTDEVIAVAAEEGEIVLFLPRQEDFDGWSVQGEKPAANDEPKSTGNGLARLGLPRMY